MLFARLRQLQAKQHEYAGPEYALQWLPWYFRWLTWAVPRNVRSPLSDNVVLLLMWLFFRYSIAENIYVQNVTMTNALTGARIKVYDYA